MDIPIPGMTAQQKYAAALPLPDLSGPMMGGAMVSPLPPTPAIPLPVAPTAAQNKYNYLVGSGSGIDQLSGHGFLGGLEKGLARAGSVAASVFAPNLAQYIPGTDAHHDLQVHQAAQNVANEQAQQQQQQQIVSGQQQNRLQADKIAAIENPAPATPEYDYVDGPNGKVAIQKGTTTYTPVTGPNGPLTSAVKAPTNAFELWHQQNPNGTFDDYNKIELKPLSQAEADTLNHVTDGIAGKHGLPTGQFKAGMPHADALQLQSALYGAIGKQQGDTRVQVTIAGQNDRAAQAAQKNAFDVSDPANAAAVAGVANGSIKLGDVFGRGATTAQKASFVAAVKAQNPNYNSGDHDIENRLRSYDIAGKGGQTLTAFNTAQTHLEILRQASDQLHNKNITAFNSLAQQYAKATGSAAPTDFNAVKNAVKGEIARSLTGNVTVSEQAELDKDFNNASSPTQIAGVAHKYIQLIDGKKQAMKDTYDLGQKGQVNFGNAQPDVYVRDKNGKLVKQ